jgi:DNA-3-methyladenine glycosylase II
MNVGSVPVHTGGGEMACASRSAILSLRLSSNVRMRKAISHLKKSDPVLAAIIERVGPFRMEFGEPVFHSLAEAIVYQQLNGKAAVTIFKRFADLAGEPVTPEGILKLTPEKMRAVGLSKQKSSYLFDMAERAHRGELDFTRLQEMTDEEVIKHLTQVKGVGVWTAHMFLMFTLKRPNVLPTGDYGVQMAIKKHYNKRKLPKPPQMEKIAKAWEPNRSIACWYLWRSLDIKTI